MERAAGSITVYVDGCGAPFVADSPLAAAQGILLAVNTSRGGERDSVALKISTRRGWGDVRVPARPHLIARYKIDHIFSKRNDIWSDILFMRSQFEFLDSQIDKLTAFVSDPGKPKLNALPGNQRVIPYAMQEIDFQYLKVLLHNHGVGKHFGTSQVHEVVNQVHSGEWIAFNLLQVRKIMQRLVGNAFAEPSKGSRGGAGWKLAPSALVFDILPHAEQHTFPHDAGTMNNLKVTQNEQL